MEQPLLTQAHPNPTSPSTTSALDSAMPADPPSSSPPFLLRLATLLSLAAVSLWANHEASKGFDITVVNAATHIAAGRRFNLMFVSNGRAARLVLNSSDFIERVLYPDEQYPKKLVRHVTLHLAAHNLSHVVLSSARRDGVDGSLQSGRFDVYLCPSLMAEAAEAVASAVHRGMAHVWLRDGQGAAPRSLLDAMAEYLVTSAGLSSGWKHNRSSAVTLFHSQRESSASVMRDASCWAGARFLHYCEARRPGFLARLNRAMPERWNEGMVDKALGSSSRKLCSAYRSSTRQPGEVPPPVDTAAEFAEVM